MKKICGGFFLGLFMLIVSSFPVHAWGEMNFVEIDGYGTELQSMCWDFSSEKWVAGEVQEVVTVTLFPEDNSIADPDFLIENNMGFEAYKISKNPSKTGATFEGWAKFVLEPDEDGIVQRKFVPKSETAPYYTLKEMLSTSNSGEYLIYAAKWSDVEIDDYYKDALVDILTPYGGEIHAKDKNYDESGNEYWVESSGIGTQLTIGKKINSQLLYKAGYVMEEDPTKEGATFEGWARFKQENGDYTFEPKSSEEPYYTTEEMMNSFIPGYAVEFNPKWSDVPIEHYHPHYYAWLLHAGEGTVDSYFQDADGEKYEDSSPATVFSARENITFEEGINKLGYVITGFKNGDASLKSWTLYEYEELQGQVVLAGEELEIETQDDDIVIYGYTATYGTTAYDKYFVICDAKKWKDNVTTEELFELTVDRNVYAVANWKTSCVGSHEWESEATIDVAATCTTKGSKSIHCKNCDEVKDVQEIPKKSHSYKKTVTKPTCTKKGYTTFTCKNCGYSYKGNYVAATGHTLKTTTTKATLSAAGKKVTKCTVCNKVTKTVTINKINTVTLSTVKYTYNGKIKKPAVTVKDTKGNKLVNGTDYTVTYASGRVDTGKYTVTVKFEGNYSGEKTLTFRILPGTTSKITTVNTKNSLKATWKKVTGATGYKVQLLSANGKVLDAEETTKLSYKFEGLNKNTVYKVKVTAYKTINGSKNYSPSSKTFKTATAPATTSLTATVGTKKAVLSWKKVACTGYEITYDTNKKFTSPDGTINVSKNTTLQRAIKNLKSGQTYYFKIRAYKLVDGVKVYSTNSNVVTVKVK